MQGKSLFSKMITYNDRNIPTCVGKRMPLCVRKQYGWEHPCIHGEKMFAFGQQQTWRGTSPYVRGKARQGSY